MVQAPIAMKPRQVLLSSSSSKPSSNGKPLSLTADQRPLLLQAVCSFLESNGFSKTLKKFLSEASLENNSWKDCSLSLEHACCLYLDARSQNDADEITIGSDKNAENIVDNDEKIKSKDKKKKKSGKDSSTLTTEVLSDKSEVAVETPGREKSSKKAKDKKTKKGCEPASELLSEDLQESCGDKKKKGSTEPEKDLKSKSERKKNKASKVDDVEENGFVVNEGEGEGTEPAKKSSKKRKKSSSEENKSDDLGTAAEDSKRRKTTDEAATHLENGNDSLQTPSTAKDSEILTGEDDNDDISLSKKSSGKKQNGSTEPRTQNAFQRVKADEVEFADEKLQDNSYWAKDGADIGYGAKAQEVLGQVRGRDFRHEKTKKKRGSYRGGPIDLQSHSVKFNYEDE